MGTQFQLMKHHLMIFLSMNSENWWQKGMLFQRCIFHSIPWYISSFQESFGICSFACIVSKTFLYYGMEGVPYKIMIMRSSYFFSSELLLSIIGGEIGGRSYISKEERCLCTSTEGVWKMTKMQSICSHLGMLTSSPWYFLDHIPIIIILFEHVG